jgi:hypothetical protein
MRFGVFLTGGLVMEKGFVRAGVDLGEGLRYARELSWTTYESIEN